MSIWKYLECIRKFLKSMWKTFGEWAKVFVRLGESFWEVSERDLLSVGESLLRVYKRFWRVFESFVGCRRILLRVGENFFISNLTKVCYFFLLRYFLTKYWLLAIHIVNILIMWNLQFNGFNYLRADKQNINVSN